MGVRHHAASSTAGSGGFRRGWKAQWVLPVCGAGGRVLGRDRAARGERDDPMAVEPLYLRPSSAEEQWDRRPDGD